ncbi:hypothetical protein BKA64DRAFT_213355 [Cadophora sp. MPI-SDFR-AT-0126]|nr:hypothetical protein BKA64DRAFT_213355 [Leotiomycetes sp. MPI-SDFR-AT-0126]
MGETRAIAVMGATGRQGRGIVDALTFNKGDIEYQVRPLTRSLTSKLARNFERDYPLLTLTKWDPNDRESLQKCFEGCYGAFVDSGFLYEPGMELDGWLSAELQLGDFIREAAEHAHLKHIVYPTFPSISRASNGEIQIRHFEIKHQIALQLRGSKVPSTILCPGPFYTDFQDMGYASFDSAAGVVVFSTPAPPQKRMGWSDPGHDIGWFARAVLDAGYEVLKDLEEVPVCGQNVSYEELASKFSAVTGIKAEYRQCGVEEFGEREGTQGVKGMEAKELGRWLAVAPDGKTCYGTIEVDVLELVERKLGVKALSWEKFLERTGWRGPKKEGEYRR